jgi:hypothetical protein
LATPIPEFSCERYAHVDNGDLGIGEIQEFFRITDLPASTFKLVTLFSLHVYRSANDWLASNRVVTFQSVFAGLDDRLRCPVRFLAEDVKDHNRVLIDPVDDPPRMVLGIDP